MIDPKKVRLMTKLAVYEEGPGKKDLKINCYSKRTYVNIKQLESIIAITVAYLLGLGLYCFGIYTDIISQGLKFPYQKYILHAMILYLIIIIIDFIGTVSGILSVHIRLARLGKLVLVEEVADNLQKAADYMGNGLTGWVLKHLEKSHEGLEIKEIIRSKLQRREKAQEMTGVFAAGCGFYKLFWLFFLGSFLGDITETIFCWWKMGTITSRSSVVYGPFSLVWGIGCFFLTYMLYQYRDRSDSFIFIFGTVLGGAYEYICSVVLELVFGTVFWDYSKIPFNLGGRINLLYCFFWGIAAVVWMKILYPKLSDFIEKIPKKIGIPLTWFLVVFMVFDMAISGLALNRYHERHQSAKTPETAITKILDTRFPDTRMERIYPSAKHVR